LPPTELRAITLGYSLAMRRLQHILAAESALAELLARRQRESKVEERVRQTLPAMLASRVTVVDARSAELVLAATSGAAAALLRQRVPELGLALAHEGWEFTGIRVRVQARSAVKETPNITPKQIDAASAATLRRLAASLDEGALAAALERLARGTGSRSSRVDEALEGVKDEDREQ
jgi:hypothetical protein